MPPPDSRAPDIPDRNSRAADGRAPDSRTLDSRHRQRDNTILLVAGGLSSLGFAPLNLWPVTLVALGLLLHRVAAARHMREAAFRGWVFAVGHFVIGLNWIATAFTYQQNMPAWLGWAAVVLLSLYLALFPALTCAVAWRTSRQRPLGFVCLFAAAWMLTEWLRATLLTGFAWNPLGVAWLAVPWVSQAARWIGTYGLSGLLLLVAGLVWMGLRHGARTTGALAVAVTAIVFWLVRPDPGSVAAAAGASANSEPRPHAASAAANAELQANAAGAGANAEHLANGPRASVNLEPPAALAQSGPRDGTGIPVRIVQPNIGQDEKYDPHEADRNTEIYAHLSGQPASAPRLLLWPEGATLRFFDIEPDARAEIAVLLGARDLLLTGGPSVTLDMHGNDDVYHNSVFALDSLGALRWRYDKAHLVPFGEYLPLRSVLGRIGLSRLVPGEGDFSFGPGPRTYPLPGFSYRGAQASFGLQICYEIIFSGHVVDEAHRPTFIFNPSNDAWFGSWGPPQHLAQARLRAIEEGIPVIRATSNGVSAVIDASGHLLAALPSHRQGVIDILVPQPLPPTPFARLGLWASALFGVLLTVVGAVACRVGFKLSASAAPIGGT
jgi:apolipoprotein N-acyltransferase